MFFFGRDETKLRCDGLNWMTNSLCHRFCIFKCSKVDTPVNVFKASPILLRSKNVLKTFHKLFAKTSRDKLFSFASKDSPKWNFRNCERYEKLRRESSKQSHHLNKIWWRTSKNFYVGRSAECVYRSSLDPFHFSHVFSLFIPFRFSSPYWRSIRTYNSFALRLNTNACEYIFKIELRQHDFLLLPFWLFFLFSRWNWKKIFMMLL